MSFRLVLLPERRHRLAGRQIDERRYPDQEVSRELRRYLRLVNYTILFGFLAYLVIFGIWLSYTTRARTFQGIPGFSYTWVTLSVPVAALLMFINTIIKFKRDIRLYRSAGPNGQRPSTSEARANLSGSGGHVSVRTGRFESTCC